MDVCFLCVFVLSGRGLCDGPILRPEESYRLWFVSECDQVKMKQPQHLWCVGRIGQDYERSICVHKHRRVMHDKLGSLLRFLGICVRFCLERKRKCKLCYSAVSAVRRRPFSSQSYPARQTIMTSCFVLHCIKCSWKSIINLLKPTDYSMQQQV
jgi:hypothetical protein